MIDKIRNRRPRILIIKPSSFGDVIHALPVLHGLRVRYPEARISWLVATSCAGLLEGHPELDEIIPFDRHHYAKLGRSFKATIDFARFTWQLRQKRFDLVIDLQGLFRSGFFSYVSGAKDRLGFASAREFAPLFYSRRVVVPDPEMHATDRYYLLADTLGFAGVPVEFVLPVSEAARESVRRRLSEGGIEADEPFALIGPGTRWETKRWPAGRWAEVARKIQAEHGLPVVLIGMADERTVAEEVAAAAGGRIVNLAGGTSLVEVIALVDLARVVVMHDSGPMHLATALNKPMVAIYGPTSPVRTGPYRRPDTIARLDLPCAPCYIKRVADCPYAHRCMQDLSPDVILLRVEKLLSQGGVRC